MYNAMLYAKKNQKGLWGEVDPYWDYIGMNLINVDFNELKNINENVVGWIQVNGTNINYPFVHTSNNDFYLTHSFDDSYNSAGWVFADSSNKLDGTDRNIVIYGHNRRDGGMFGTLKNILTDEWQSNSENLIIPFITENEK